ncbi:hypothetical protein QBC47DRAFT_385026 [Echria macrotheca]|uniref:Uncharacterized protein n=1 Tax=Echria macrotheca TaxID=438768 RepID=A0AAJ0FB12_9PEZI|nr:hypothetical protein QBC47DRAFT_385026 [Echria macrotheca]
MAFSWKALVWKALTGCSPACLGKRDLEMEWESCIPLPCIPYHYAWLQLVVLYSLYRRYTYCTVHTSHTFKYHVFHVFHVKQMGWIP